MSRYETTCRYKLVCPDYGICATNDMGYAYIAGCKYCIYRYRLKYGRAKMALDNKEEEDEWTLYTKG
jgi:hypothetical protein